MFSQSSFLLAVTSVVPLLAQSPTQPTNPDRISIERVPIHASDTGADDYGLRAAADSYKARFDQGATFSPYLGRHYPEGRSWTWHTRSVRIGERSLLGAGRKPSHWHSDYRYEYRFDAVTEAYDVRVDGLEQTFVVHERPATAGDLVVVGSVESNLTAPPASSAHQDLTFYDESGAAIVQYGAAVVIDANDRRLPISTSHYDGQITLTVPSAWLLEAQFPVTIDPLLTRVSVVSTNDTIEEVDVCHNQTTNTTLVSYCRLASATLYDLYVFETDGNYSTPALVYSDLGPYNTPYARLSATGSTFAVAMQRNLTVGRRITIRIHNGGTFSPNGQTYGFSTPTGFDDWRPDVSGSTVGSQYLVVFQRDERTNPTSSDVLGRYISTAGVQSGEFTIAAGCSDVEWPAISQYENAPSLLQSNVRMVVWQRQPCASVPTWVEGKLVDFNGNLSTATWSSANNSSSSTGLDVAHPQVAGRSGRYLVSTTLGQSFPQRRGTAIELERVDWTSLTGTPTTKPSITLFGPYTSQRVRVGGLAYDDDTKSHWAITTDHDHTGGGNGFGYIDRIGFNGASTRRRTIQSAGSTQVQALAGGISYSGQEQAFRFGWSVTDSSSNSSFVWINRLTRPTAAAPSLAGLACSSATPSWVGLQQIGYEFSSLHLSGALPNVPAIAVIGFDTANTDLTTFGMPGCRLLVPASGPNYVGTFFTLTDSASESSIDLALPEFLSPATVYFQWFFLQPGANAVDFVSTQRLEVDIVK